MKEIQQALAILRTISPEFKVERHLVLQRRVKTKDLTLKQLHQVIKVKNLIQSAQRALSLDG
jgi:hypothetical protein